MIYLDNAATTRTRGEVVEAMLPYFIEHYGNPESVHAAAEVPKQAIENAEQHVRDLLHSYGKGKVIFTSGGTESNNMVFKLCQPPKQSVLNIITSVTEHKSVLEPARACDRVALRFLRPKKDGFIAGDALTPMDIPAFSLISLMHINNETGAVNEVYKIGEMLKRFSDLDVFFHVDCIQSAGEIPIFVNEMNVDMVSISSHKIHGPKGIGCLWVSDRLMERIVDGRNLAVILGGGQQSGFRAGTMDVPSIVGFGKACEIAADTTQNKTVINMMAKMFIESLTKQCDNRNIKMHLNFEDETVHDNKILSIRFDGADAETVVMVSSRNGLCISNGAACNSVLSEPSYVLLGSGISPDDARNTVRVSFSCDNTLADIENAAEILAESVEEVLALNLTQVVG